MKTNRISFVIPAKDEQDTIRTLHAGITNVMTKLGLAHEIILIDDGSRDNTWTTMRAIADEFPGVVQAIRLRRNIGKARALALGFERATGDIVFTMDADLQDDPLEIPRFLAKLDEGYDLVSGYKQTRHDPWHKVLPSRIFNRMVSRLNGVTLHDHNCGFKCYRAAVVKNVRLYGEMHRMVPSLASIEGFPAGEIVVQHHPRRFGQSKYGVKRFLRGFLDMLTVWFLKNYRERPLHLLGGWAMAGTVLGMLLLAVGLTGINHYGSAPTLAGAGAALLASAGVVFAVGLLAELQTSNRKGATDLPPVAEDVVHGSQGSEDIDWVEAADQPEILLVDDDPFSLMMYERLLRNSAFKVARGATISAGSIPRPGPSCSCGQTARWPTKPTSGPSSFGMRTTVT
jgi:glycosyltransferase involved in cell wall biosynthesis